MTSCGWLLSVLRAPSGTGIIPKRQYRNPRYVPDVSISASCQALTRYGLNVNMQEFLALLQTSTSIENFVSNFGITVYAASLRAKMQLSILYHKYRNDIEHLTNYHASQSLLDSVSGASTINDVCKNNANSCSRV